MTAPAATGFDLLRLPLVGRFFRWRHSRLTLQLPLLALAVLMILHGLFGPDLAPKNFATLLTWVHYRGILVVVLLAAGNFFCAACPLLLPRELIRLFVKPALVWPRALRNKWLAAGLFVAILFVYEYWALYETPAGTAALILGYFVAATVVDSLFAHASFCKWVCPIGQFNFLASALSPLEVRVRDQGVCAGCKTKDCIKGTPAPPDTGRRHALPVVQRGCELALFAPRKVGNFDCTFCMDCVQACPYDNIGVVGRVPGSELYDERSHSGIGEPHRRNDWAALTVAFTFGALVNAFAMVSPGHAFIEWLHGRTGTSSPAGLLGMLFFLALVVEPVVLLGLAALVTKLLTPEKTRPAGHADALRPEPDPDRLRHLAGALLLPLPDRLLHVHPAGAARRGTLPGRAVVATDRRAGTVRPPDRDGPGRPGASRLVPGGVAAGEARRPGQPVARLRVVGRAAPAAGRRRGVGAVAADGDARHLPGGLTIRERSLGGAGAAAPDLPGAPGA